MFFTSSTSVTNNLLALSKLWLFNLSESSCAGIYSIDKEKDISTDIDYVHGHGHGLGHEDRLGHGHGLGHEHGHLAWTWTRTRMGFPFKIIVTERFIHDPVSQQDRWKSVGDLLRVLGLPVSMKNGNRSL